MINRITDCRYKYGYMNHSTRQYVLSGLDTQKCGLVKRHNPKGVSSNVRMFACWLTDGCKRKQTAAEQLKLAGNATDLMWEADCVWNVMEHEQKPDFVFRRNGRVHLNRWGASVQSTTGRRCVRISGSYGSNAGYTMFRGSLKSIGYPLHSPVSPSLPLPVRHRVPSHFNWTVLAPSGSFLFVLVLHSLSDVG